MISSSSLIFIVTKNISLAMLSSLAAAASPSPVQCRRSPLPTLVDCYFCTTGKGSRSPPTPPPLTIFHFTPNLICSSLHHHHHPLVDCCLYGGSSVLMTNTHGPGVSRLSDTGHNTGSTTLGLGWEQLWLLLRRRLWRLQRQRHDARQGGGAGGFIALIV